jgi:maltose alpha-D-glucosyltransferase/alpha-amylase
LDREAVAGERWFGRKGRAIESIELVAAFVLDASAPHVLAVARLGLDDRSTLDASWLLTGRPLRPATGTEGAGRSLMAAIAEGRAVAAIGRGRGEGGVETTAAGRVTAVLVCRPAIGLRGLVPAGDGGKAGSGKELTERPLGADQSNTSLVIGESILLKVYRRLEAGLNPELELVAYLAEEAGFAAVPPLAGYAEMVTAAEGTSTVAVAQAFVADGADAYETIAEALTAALLGPGDPAADVADAAVAADLGRLTAELHVALMNARGISDFEPHPASRHELRSWGRAARVGLSRAIDATSGEAARALHDLAPRIAAELTVFEALPSPPLVGRIHGDYHLGQVLIAPDGYRIVDFEGEPARPLEERRAYQSPLRDVASMLRSLDHVGRSAGRRAAARHDGPVRDGALDLDAWLRSARARFLDAYEAEIRRAGSALVVDPTLIRAFEIEKECSEFVYAATYLPTWSWAPTEGLRGLFA